jgi:hypothetical protein
MVVTAGSCPRQKRPTLRSSRSWRGQTGPEIDWSLPVSCLSRLRHGCARGLVSIVYCRTPRIVESQSCSDAAAAGTCNACESAGSVISTFIQPVAPRAEAEASVRSLREAFLAGQMLEALRAVDYEVPSFDAEPRDVELSDMARAGVEIRHVRGASDAIYLVTNSSLAGNQAPRPHCFGPQADHNPQRFL